MKRLERLSTEFVDSTKRPKAIRTYKGTDALDMNEMSTRFMGVSDDRLRETIKVSNGLSATPGKVRTRTVPTGQHETAEGALCVERQGAETAPGIHR